VTHGLSEREVLVLKPKIFAPTMLFTVLILQFAPASAQEILWSRTYGGSGVEYSYAVEPTTDGGYVVVGYTWSFGSGNADVYMVKTDSTGDTSWTRTYGGSESDFGSFVRQTPDGGYIITGHTYSIDPDSRYVYLLKTDSLGNLLWTRTYGDFGWHEGWSVQQTSDGGYVIGGYTWPFGAGAGDFYLIKTDSVGDTLWTRTYGGVELDGGNYVQQTMDDGYILVGATASFGAGNFDVYLIKTDSLGDTLWTRTYGGGNEDMGWSARQTTDGGYVAVGHTASFGSGCKDAYLIRTDSLGDTLWTRTYGGSDDETGWSVQQAADQGFIVAGYTRSFGSGGFDVYVIKTDSSGDEQWSRTYGGNSNDYAYSVRQTADEAYVVAAYTWSFGAGDCDVMLTRLDSSGKACVGEFVSSNVMNVSSSLASPPAVLTSPPTMVTSFPTMATEPLTEVTTVCMRVCGDVNWDDIIDLGDAVYLLNYLFKGGDPPDPLERGNVNCDDTIDLGDAVYLLNYLFKNGPPPCC
jgi:hypothetical protein